MEFIYYKARLARVCLMREFKGESYGHFPRLIGLHGSQHCSEKSNKRAPADARAKSARIISAGVSFSGGPPVLSIGAIAIFSGRNVGIFFSSIYDLRRGRGQRGDFATRVLISKIFIKDLYLR